MGLIIAALVAFAGFLAFMRLLITASLNSCIRADPNMALISPETDLALILICFAIAWILGYFQKNTFAFYNVGTKYYGRNQAEEGYIATKWITFLFPILPIRSYVVYYETQNGPALEFEIQKGFKRPFQGYFYFPQVFRIASISYGTIIWCWGCLWLMFAASCF
ncbi:MAG: hypothetical protein AB1649_07480 [Chloroflexota bacterium]